MWRGNIKIQPCHQIQELADTDAPAVVSMQRRQLSQAKFGCSNGGRGGTAGGSTAWGCGAAPLPATSSTPLGQTCLVLRAPVSSGRGIEM